MFEWIVRGAFHTQIITQSVKLLSLSVVRCSVLTNISWLKKRSSDEFEQGVHRHISITSFITDVLFVEKEKNLVPMFELVNAFKIEINLHKSYNVNVLVNDMLLSHVSKCAHARKLTKLLSRVKIVELLKRLHCGRYLVRAMAIVHYLGFYKYGAPHDHS